MRIHGQCDFCKTKGDWEAGIFYDQAEVKKRPVDWAAAFPTNVSKLPENCTFRTEDLERDGIETAFACPKCVRLKASSFVPPKRKEVKPSEL